MTYAEEAREKAKRDVREKRQKFSSIKVQQTKHTNSQLTAKPKVEAKPSFEATVEPAAEQRIRTSDSLYLGSSCECYQANFGA